MSREAHECKDEYMTVHFIPKGADRKCRKARVDPLAGLAPCLAEHQTSQPDRRNAVSVMSDKEIRNKLLESDDPKGWKYSIGEQMRDNLTNDQAAMLAYYFYAGDMTTLGRYFAEIMVATILITMRNEIEDYKDNHSINDEQDDCSAYKEHRDLNPEKYT